MATDLAPKPHGRDAVPSRAAGRDDVVDLTLLELRPAPEATHLPGALEVEVVAGTGQPRVEPVHPRRFARGVVGVLVALLAPLLVLLGALVLPVSEAVQGAVLVAGWVLLGVLGRVVGERRDREHR